MRITSSLTARAANSQYLVGTGSPNVHDSLAGNCELVLQEPRMEHECEGAKPSWATDHGLQRLFKLVEITMAIVDSQVLPA